MVEARRDLRVTDRFEHSYRSHPGHIHRVLGNVERDAHVRLRAKVVDLIGLDLVDQSNQPARLRQIGVVEEELDVTLVTVAVDLSQTARVER